MLVGQQDKGPYSLYAHESQGNVLDYLRRPSVSRLGCLSPLGTVRLLLVLALAKTMVVTEPEADAIPTSSDGMRLARPRRYLGVRTIEPN